MLVRTLEPHEAAAFRDIRLRSLEADPDAFGSNHQLESNYSDQEWTDFLASEDTGVVFVAESDGVAVGLTGVRADDGTESAVLWGMWVSPGARGQGVGRQLVDAAVDWARSAGVDEVILQVARGNDTAHRLYAACGFTDRGQAPLRPDDPCSLAWVMGRTL